MVEPSFLAETCTPSSFWPEAEVIEPVSNWSAEAVLAAPTRTRPATLANSWPRKCVMVFLSSHGCSGSASLPTSPHAGRVGRGRAVAWHSQQTPNAATGRYPSARIVRVATRFSKQARANWRHLALAHAEPQVRRTIIIQQFSLPTC